MLEFYKLDIIPNLLRNFKVKKVIISGLKNEGLVNEFLNYEATFTAIDSDKTHPQIDTIKGHSLDILPLQGDYEAIIIDDDPNWYTVYNELNLIKKSNDEFPLVFICNNRFPHKFRDSYSNPELIPQEFRQEYVKELPIIYDNKEIIITDDYLHACEENTPKNGVSTAINDFISENAGIGIMDIHFIEEITILYPKSTISQIRIDNLKRDCEDKKITYEGLSDALIENQMLISYIDNPNTSINNFKPVDESKISEYENKLNVQDSQIKYKNSQIVNIKSELNIKDLQIKNIESKLVNKDTAIDRLVTEINEANDEIDHLKKEIEEEKSLSRSKEADLKFKFETTAQELETLKKDFAKTESYLKNQHRKELEAIKKSNAYQYNQLNSKEYCISCFKEEIANKKHEIDYLKNDSLLKRILSPLSYAYLLLKSDPKEISINYKLYKALKNSECFDIGYYLNNNEDIQKSKWIKYFSPELHYICNGFNENREFNKKYYNRKSKEALLNYLMTCESKE